MRGGGPEDKKKLENFLKQQSVAASGIGGCCGEKNAVAVGSKIKVRTSPVVFVIS
jgi:hypothetical protein